MKIIISKALAASSTSADKYPPGTVLRFVQFDPDLEGKVLPATTGTVVSYAEFRKSSTGAAPMKKGYIYLKGGNYLPPETVKSITVVK